MYQYLDSSPTSLVTLFVGKVSSLLNHRNHNDSKDPMGIMGNPSKSFDSNNEFKQHSPYDEQMPSQSDNVLSEIKMTTSNDFEYPDGYQPMS